MHYVVDLKWMAKFLAKIQISAFGAATIESAIVTYGHELAHFGTNNESSANVYGYKLLELYQGK